MPSDTATQIWLSLMGKCFLAHLAHCIHIQQSQSAEVLHPDNAGGDEQTFGLLDLSGPAVRFLIPAFSRSFPNAAHAVFCFGQYPSCSGRLLWWRRYVDSAAVPSLHIFTSL